MNVFKLAMIFFRNLCGRHQNNSIDLVKKIESSGVYPNGISWYLSGGTKGDYCPNGPSAVHLMGQTAKGEINFKCAHCGKEERKMRIVIVTSNFYLAKELEAFLESRGHEFISVFRTYHFASLKEKFEETAMDSNTTRPLFDLIVSDGTCKDYSAPCQTTSIAVSYNYPLEWAKTHSIKGITINQLLRIKKFVEHNTSSRLVPIGI